MDTKKKLDTEITHLVQSRKAFAQHFNLETLEQYIDVLIASHRIVATSFNTITPQLSRRLSDNVNSNDNRRDPSLAQYFLYVNKLERNAKLKETTQCLSTIIAANEKYIEILNELKDNLSKYFNMEKINMFNMKLSHVVISGVLYQSDILSTYSKYLISLIVNTVTEGEDPEPKYRAIFIAENTENIAKVVSAVIGDEGAVNFSDIIENIKVNA